MTDEANAEPTGKILSFPTEQRRVSVATERQSSEFMTPDDLVGMLTSSDLDILSGIDFDKMNLSIDSYDNNDVTYSWDEFISKVDFTAGPDKNMYGDTKAVYTSTLETVTNLLVEVHRLNAQAQDGVIDELNYQLEDLVKWLKTQ
jgi:hypothetical protein